jgi:hypothetical protein
MTRIILTIPQARQLQREHHATDDYGQWQFLVDVHVPSEPIKRLDDARVDAGVKMLELGCADEQVGEQLNWYGSLRSIYNVLKVKQRYAGQ